MSFDKKIKRFIGISAAILGIAFIGMNILAKKKKPSSVGTKEKRTAEKIENFIQSL